MFRRLFTLASCLSLILCAGTGVLALASAVRPLSFEFVGRDGLLWEAAARRGRLFADTFPQYRLDQSPYVHDEFQKIAREFQPYQRQYDQKLRLWRKGGISRAEWEDFLKDNKQARERLRNRMAALEPLLVRLIAVRPPTIYSIHCSTIMGPTAVLPCGWLVIQLCARRRRLLRLKNSLCPRCGYDLRATPDRCPECGNIPEKSPC